eukprot:scaffold15998_cov111-Isochrysis_galbana.AAC.4
MQDRHGHPVAQARARLIRLVRPPPAAAGVIGVGHPGHAASYAVPQRRVEPREGSLGRTSQPSLLSRVERGLRSRWLKTYFWFSMEQTPADARAAPSASEPNDTVMDIHASPKRQRESSQGNMVRQRATTNAPLWPESPRRAAVSVSRVSTKDFFFGPGGSGGELRRGRGPSAAPANRLSCPELSPQHATHTHTTHTHTQHRISLTHNTLAYRILEPLESSRATVSSPPSSDPSRALKVRA